MGYEVKMVIVSENGLCPHEAFVYGLEVARIDLCKIGSDCQLYELIQKQALEKNGGFFADDGNTLISKDAYGDPVKRVAATKVLAALKADGDSYRRFHIARVMLEAVLETFNRDSIVCHFFGH